MNVVLSQLCVFILVSLSLKMQAQTIIPNWATLTSNVSIKPWCIAVDPSGNVYTENTNGTISKITPSGIVIPVWSTISGSAAAITTDASGNVYTIDTQGNVTVFNPSAGTISLFPLGSASQPIGIVTDAAGNIYTANAGNSTVSKITTSTGTLTLQWATLASDAFPSGIAIDASGNLYTSNGGNNTVSKITPDGTVTQAWATLADAPYSIAVDVSGNVYTGGTNISGLASLTKILPDGGLDIQPMLAFSGTASVNGIVTDAAGNVYAARYNSASDCKITKVAAAGGTQTWAIASSLAYGDWPIAVDATGNVFIALDNNSTVSKISSTGVLSVGWASITHPVTPYDIIADATGNIYTTNIENNTVSKISPNGSVTQAWTTYDDGISPWGIATDPLNNIFTANSNNTISKITPDGTFTKDWATLASNAYPQADGITTDAYGVIYTANRGNNTISKIIPTGTVTQAWATLNSGAGPVGIAIDPSGNIFTTNNNNTISKITAAGTVIEVFATLAPNAFPHGLVIDAGGNIFTANSGNNTISKITAGGVVTQAWATLAGDAYPSGIVIDAAANIYTANYNNTVSKITPSGIVTTAFAVLTADAHPLNIAIDTWGNLFTANRYSNTVTKIVTAQTAAALNFDGINDIVAISHNALLKPSAGITIEAWINPVNIHSNVFNEIYRKEDGIDRQLFSFQNNGTVLSFGLGIGGNYSEFDVNIVASDYENQWVHVAATYDGTAQKIYRNGVLIGSFNIIGAIGISGTASAYIGANGGTSEFFNGSIDELSLWNRALSAAEIQNNLNCEINPASQSGLIALYHFNQGLGGQNNAGNNVLPDATSHLLHGVLTNFALNGASSNWVTPGGVQTGLSCTVAFDLCPGDNFAITSDFTGSEYQWQFKSPGTTLWTDFSNLPSDYFSTSSATQTLSRNSIASNWAGTQFRCRVDNINYSSVYNLKFKSQWTGAVSNLWSDAGNWSCGMLPDANTDVIINSGPVIVNVNGICNSIHIMPAVNFTVNSGFELTIVH